MLKKLTLALFFLLCGASLALAAWPLTPRTTYVAGTTPAIKAADLNAFQEAFNKIFLGEWSLKGVVVDGTGGAASSPVAGSVVVSRSIVGNTMPTPSAAAGELPKSLVPICWAHIDAVAGLQQGANVVGASRSALGVFSVTCNRQTADPTKDTVVVTVDSANPRVAVAVPYSDGGNTAATIRIWDLSGTAKDEYFSVIFYGE